MGRPMLSETDLRREVSVYFTPTELTGLKEKAGRAGLPLSAFVRRAALGQTVSAAPFLLSQHWATLTALAERLAANDPTTAPETLAGLGEAVAALRRDLSGSRS